MLTASLAGRAAAQEDYQANEYEIKAAYVLNFTNFVEWPGTSSGKPAIHVCLVGSDPLSASLSRMIGQRTSRDQPFFFRRMTRTEGVGDCQILYISPSEGKYVPQLLDSLRGARILTVGENDRFAAMGGIIQLVMENSRIRFKINSTAASEAGIRISSKLLALAEIVTSAHPTQAAKHQATLREEPEKMGREAITEP